MDNPFHHWLNLTHTPQKENICDIKCIFQQRKKVGQFKCPIQCGTMWYTLFQALPDKTALHFWRLSNTTLENTEHRNCSKKTFAISILEFLITSGWNYKANGAQILWKGWEAKQNVSEASSHVSVYSDTSWENDIRMTAWRQLHSEIFATLRQCQEEK
jgi:hypothetical protein